MTTLLLYKKINNLCCSGDRHGCPGEPRGRVRGQPTQAERVQDHLRIQG